MEHGALTLVKVQMWRLIMRCQHTQKFFTSRRVVILRNFCVRDSSSKLDNLDSCPSAYAYARALTEPWQGKQMWDPRMAQHVMMPCDSYNAVSRAGLMGDVDAVVAVPVSAELVAVCSFNSCV